MNCPHCGKPVEIPDTVFTWMQSYGDSAKTMTFCCDKLVRVRPVVTYTIEAVDAKPGDLDDWGNEVKP